VPGEAGHKVTTTYNAISTNSGPGTPWGGCPTAASQQGKDPFTINSNGAGATYFDDIGWWTSTWLAACKFAGNPDYLYLAEELWNYGASNPVNFATRASILEGLDADLGQQEADAGQPHYGMC
jgi:hypothetical protein